MKIKTRGKNMEVTPALHDYVEKRLAKLEKYFDSDLEASVTMSVARESHIVEVTISIDGLLLRGEENSGDMYASIDSVVDKLERQTHKYKTKINRKLRQKGLKELNEQYASPEPVEEDFEAGLVKTKQFVMKPMPVEEAILQMDLLGHNFFVFSSAETGEINVVYKRKDGNYGLIEPAE